MKIVFATNNKHKLQEARKILGTEYELLSLKDIGFEDELREDFHTLEENAKQKAFYIHRKFGMDCFADDTGLEVFALGGEPGVHSARYAGHSRDPKANMNKLLREMHEKDMRKARFRTVISLFLEKKEYVFDGIIHGVILSEPRGDQGFGYDPVFAPDGSVLSFAEMEPAEKNRISHRALAVNKMKEFLSGR